MKRLTITTLLAFLMLTFCYAQLVPVTSNLVNPAGIEPDASGNIWLTETGTGANNGRVILVRPNGDKIPIITGLPSNFDATTNETGGPWSTILLPNNRVAVIVGEGPTFLFGRIMLFNLTGFQPGISPAKTIADTTSTIDISRFALAQTGVTNSNPFSAVLDSDGSWYVVDAGANMIIKVTAGGQRSVFARFPKVPNPTPVGPPVVDAVPTKIIANPDGGFYVTNLTGFPFNKGQASVFAVDRNGNVTTYAKGFTMLTDLALDPRTGDLYALQFGEFGFAPTPGFIFGSGKVHRIQRGGVYSEVIASNFGPGSGLTLDANGNIYVTSLFTSQLLRMNSLAAACNNFDLSITADNNNLTLYSSIKYTLRITNRGTTNATNVRVFWLPPYKRFEGDAKPFAYQAAYSSKGHYDSWHGYWTIDNLAPGETATATFHLFVVNNTLNATQTAQVAACNQRSSNLNADNSVVYQAQLVTMAGSENNLSPLSISPNPAYEKINIGITNETDKEWTVKLLNSIGQTVAIQKGQHSRTVHMDIDNLQNGLYLVDYQSAGERKIEKVIIQH